MHKTHSSWGRAGSFCLPVAQAPAASLSPALTLQSCLEITGDCVAGPGWAGRFKLGLSEGAYLGGACLVDDLGGCHAQSAPGCQILIPIVSGVAGQPIGRAGP